MSRPCLITYDIANPKRLVRLHRALRSWGIPIQYSVFHADLTDAGVGRVADLISRLIDPRTDDVRIYFLPRGGWSCALGKPVLPQGISWTGLPLPFRPDPENPIADPAVRDTTPAATSQRRAGDALTQRQRRAARDILAKVQTGERRGIVLMKP